MRIHIGAGTVYLREYINVDLPGEQTFLAYERPDLIERWGTTGKDYYSRHQDKSIETIRKGPTTQEAVCDRYGSFEFLPFRDCVADEALIRQAFEHLSITEARRALAEIARVMRRGGILRIDVPDHVGTLEKYAETRDRFYMRHLLGPRRGDAYGHHMMSYEREQLSKLVTEFSFQYCGEEPNIHIYPAFCLRFEKI